MSTNYLAAYEALKIFRDATLTFIKTHLEAAYGDDWWNRGVARGFKPETIQELEAQFNRRFDSPLGPARPGQERHEILDINWFTNILEANWKTVFAAPFHNDRATLTLVREVAELRNPVAHPESGDLAYNDVWRGLDSMERLLRVIDPSANKQIKELQHRLLSQQLAQTPSTATDTSDKFAWKEGDLTILKPAQTSPPAPDTNPTPAPAAPPTSSAEPLWDSPILRSPAISAAVTPTPSGTSTGGKQLSMQPAAPTTATSLQHRIQAEVRLVLGSYPGAWLVWCDPRGDWAPLLGYAAADPGPGGFPLVRISETTADEAGSPRLRAELQARIDAGESFVLLVPVAPTTLGWLWAHALRAERIVGSSLREALLGWGWQPQSLTLTDDMLAVLAVRSRLQDPAAWGGGGLQPDLAALLEVLAGSQAPDPGERLILDLTIDHAGLPPLEDNLALWRTRALARLLVTQAQAVASHLIGDSHELLLPVGQRKFALDLLDRWLDSLRLSRHLGAAIVEADKIAGLAAVLAAVTIGQGPFLSHTAERAVFANTCQHLAAIPAPDLLDALALLQPDLQHHAAGFWGSGTTHPHTIAWSELLRLSQAAATLQAAWPTNTWATPAEAIAWYTGGGWRVDQAGEEILRDLTKSPPELLALISPLRAAYRTRWEYLMRTWSEVWTGAGCPLPAIGTAGEWLQTLLKHPRPTVILVADALRYDLGATLAAELNQDEGTQRATVQPARAPLPSITALGMGLALPIAESRLEADLVDGKWQLRAKGDPANLSQASDRRAWWRAHGKVAEDAILTLAEVLSSTVPPPAPKRSRLVIYDDAIDKLGHDDELEALGSGMIRERYLKAIQRLRQEGWLRILIVTDHGYIHWSSSEEHSVPPPAPNPAYQSRRALAYPLEVSLPLPHGLAPGGRWRIAVVPGASSFRAYGGLGYFHGGASLQEWITPCVQIEWPLKAQPVMVDLQPMDQVLGERLRITLNVVRSSMFAENDLPREVQVVIRNAVEHTILFRSAPAIIKPNEPQARIEVQAVPGAVAERGIDLQIEVRDTHTEEVLTTSKSILMTELSGW